jgi:branched-subunit amino acid transport protein
MLFIRKPIKNRFIRSMLYYIPYSVLAVMTVPAIFYITENLATGIIAAVFAVTLAYLGHGLITVAACSAAVVLICEMIIKWI